MGVGGLIHGEHFIVDSYILNGTHTQADMIITTVPLPTVLVVTSQLSQRLSLLNRTDRV